MDNIKVVSKLTTTEYITAKFNNNIARDFNKILKELL